MEERFIIIGFAASKKGPFELGTSWMGSKKGWDEKSFWTRSAPAWKLDPNWSSPRLTAPAQCNGFKTNVECVWAPPFKHFHARQPLQTIILFQNLTNFEKAIISVSSGSGKAKMRVFTGQKIPKEIVISWYLYQLWHWISMILFSCCYFWSILIFQIVRAILTLNIFEKDRIGWRYGWWVAC